MTDTAIAKAASVRRRQGSIITQKGKKGITYRLKFDMPGLSASGDRRTVYKTVKAKSRKEAERELRKLIGQAEKGVQLDVSKQTLASWIDIWLRDHICRKVTTRTFEGYSGVLKRHVVPSLGPLALLQLAPLHVEKLYHTLAESGYPSRVTRGEKRKATAAPKGLAPRTINHVHRVLFKCLKDAARLRLIDHNPMVDVEAPRMKKSAATAEKQSATQMKILTPEQLSNLPEGFKGCGYEHVSQALVLLAIDSGARRGELLALQWSDVDFEKRTLRIARAVDETKTNGVLIKAELKNDSSRRTVTISARTIEALRAEWKNQAENQLKLGRRIGADALIFPAGVDDLSVPIPPHKVSKAFARGAKKLGFKGLRFHDLRHNCASHMLNAGRSVPDVARHLGHSNPAVTMSVYAHAVPEQQSGLGLLDGLLPAIASHGTNSGAESVAR